MRLKNASKKKILEVIEEIKSADTEYYNCVKNLLGRKENNEYGF